jgi:hypothetical protein
VVQSSVVECSSEVVCTTNTTTYVRLPTKQIDGAIINIDVSFLPSRGIMHHAPSLISLYTTLYSTAIVQTSVSGDHDGGDPKDCPL